MEWLDLEGNSFKIPVRSKRRTSSKLHSFARDLIRQNPTHVPFLEEVKVRVRRGRILYLDFLLPSHNIVIEVHGKQHYTYIPHFHKTRSAFLDHKRRDNEKIDLCFKNEVYLLELKYDEKSRWGDQIRDCVETNSR